MNSLKLKMYQNMVGWGSAPDHTGGAYDEPQTPTVVDWGHSPPIGTSCASDWALSRF